MPYFGTDLKQFGYATTEKDTFSGDDSTVAFTLSKTSTTNDVEVFVGNVQQEPTIAYSISGSTLTFTEAPPTGTNNIYVLHRGRTRDTILPPADLGDKNYLMSGGLKIADGANIGSVSDTDAISIASTGDVTLTQNLKVKDGGTIGSASDADAITIASDGKVTLAETVTVSKGIKFPATQVASTDANTLDDYEEGTFTPVIRGSTTAGTYELNTSFDDGFYQKVGRMVTVRVVVALAGSITGGGTGDYVISGLPFNYDVSHNAGYGAVACDSVDFDRTASGIVGICIGAQSGTDSDFLRILQIEDSASFRTLPISQAAAADFFEFTYTYATTA
tara:strand:+ start:588 stop:1586 length:999 start_codon:yes stop_codon:yes gene_type:complete